ncbi:hypothetical protein [Larkinella humicola]|uniref:Uncharacterized protein n=1 Tax=Larkinella humicola TaxID=2607654 RepID=A0A5N1JFS3_9BACT|nr:hypothetical protein [Larkinella humicola]KAA9349986.1 hypothetical protein F0P93_21360 [Larkinella humicola]
MKTILFAVGIGFVTPCTLQAQSSDVIRIKGGSGGEKAVSVPVRYRYDQFCAGKVIYRNGTMATARFNYNILLGEMQFINASGDTLALANEPVVRQVDLSEPTSAGAPRQTVFLYDPKKGYLEVLADHTTLKLVVKQGLKMARNEKAGGYDQSSGTAATTTYQSYSSGNTSVSKLDWKGDLVVIKGRDYFIIDRNDRSYPLNKASLLKVFAKHRQQVLAYLETESINFKQEDDLKKLLNYCSEFP